MGINRTFASRARLEHHRPDALRAGPRMLGPAVLMLISVVFIPIAVPAQTVTPYTCPTPPDLALIQANVNQLIKTNRCSGCSLIKAELAGLNLANAQLDRADLTCANLSKTVLSYADLSSAKLINATLQSATLVAATLNCTDFSYSNLSTVNFGTADGIFPVVSADMDCRTNFSYGVVDLKMFALQQIRYLDLSYATLLNRNLLTNPAFKNYSRALMAGVDLSNLQFPAGSIWTGAQLPGSILDGANFSGAQMGNANLSYAHASGTIFTGAHFEADQVKGIEAAKLNHAYLADAQFNNAVLSYADLSYVNLNGPKATLANATLTGTIFTGANLSGMHLESVSAAQGVNFIGANLGNANLKNLNATFNVFIAQNTRTIMGSKFDSAYLCGATIDSTTLTCADLSNAFVLSSPQNYAPPGGTAVSCGATVYVSAITDNVNSKDTTCSTTCPDGGLGPCTTRARWNFRDTAPIQCCVRKDTDPPCPNRKKDGATCTQPCDCKSQKCSDGICAPTSVMSQLGVKP